MPPKPKPEKQDKKKKRKPKTERQLLDDECMEYIKWIVRWRDKGCVTPGSSCYGQLTASHYHKRGKKKIRYDIERNIHCQCQGCNLRHNNYQYPYEYYMLTKFTNEDMKQLALDAAEDWKWSIPELREIRDGLKAEYERLKPNETV